MIFLSGTALSWAQLSPDPGQDGTGVPEQNAPDTLPELETDPKFEDHGAGVPCPPGSQSAPNSGDDFGDKGGTQSPDQSSPRGRHAVPPVVPDSGVNPPPGGQNENGGLSQGDEMDQPGSNRNQPDQFGMIDCPPGGSDRGGGLNQDPIAPGPQNEPPILLPPSGSTQ
jgi:hypothetical protein